jgi:hypothetical protein
LKWGTVGKREKRMEREGGGGGQYTSNLGPEWTGVAPHAKEGFQVSKRGGDFPGRGVLSRGIVKGLSRGLCHVLQYNVSPVHIVLIVYVALIKELCLGYK